jgi:hypothetical protein
MFPSGMKAQMTAVYIFLPRASAWPSIVVALWLSNVALIAVPFDRCGSAHHVQIASTLFRVLALAPRFS